MPANNAAQAGEGQINLFEFESNYSRPKLDIANGVIELSYYESILDTEISAYAKLVDTGYRTQNGYSILEEDGINSTAGEKINLKITDGYGTTLSFTKEKHLRVRIPSELSGTTNKLNVSLSLFTQESIDNEEEEKRVIQHYDGKISDIVTKILRDVLGTPKNLNIEETLNTASIVPTTTKPFYQCTWLGPRGVPNIPNAKGILAGFFFYETYDGFNFRSIDKLSQQQPKRRFIYTNTIDLTVPVGYDAKILEPPSISSSFDLKTILRTGSHTLSALKGLNPYESSYRKNDFDSSSQFNSDTITGKEQPRFATDLNIQEKVSKISYTLDGVGFVVEGKKLLDQLPKSTYVNWNKDEILRQSSMRYNNLFTLKMSVVVPGDFTLRAGDLIFCDFPEISGQTTKTVSKKISGLYMIVDLCHYVSQGGCYTRMNVVRESIGRKPFK